MILIDPPVKKPDDPEDLIAPSKLNDASPLMGRFFAVLSLLLLLVPPLGLAASISALIASRKERGWHRVLAKTTFGLSLAICLLFGAIALLATFLPPQSHR
jgi:hypothetical protein